MTDERPLDVALENRLMGKGIYVTACEYRPPDGTTTDDAGSPDAGIVTPPDGTGLAIEYETVAETDAIGSGEVGTVVRTLLDVAAEREWAPGRLEATSLTTDGDVRGRWHVEREWFDQLGLGLDDIEFSQRVLETRRPESADE